MKSKTSVPDAATKRPGRPTVDRREEILEAAQRLYESIGFEKTTIGDVARDLGMSPANLYRSFPNRQALDEAIAGRILSTIGDEAWAAARAESNAALALEALSRAVLKETQHLLFSDQKMHHLCAVAAREMWPVVTAYLDGLRGAVRHVIMEGQRSGAFRKVDPEETADTICAALTQVWHPHMIEAFAGEDLMQTSDRICQLLVSGLNNKMI
ncbi:MAG: TetR/AcrR family transcriptional regulator [Pseudomonadota bacterium]|uniref:TetR/AcrR family transcriptional regulator n=1 Tax=Phenylobacterium sp. TaxID=1871053 RepID=UPI0025F2353B|nr:TetR/AcrR family transcriptional regulator [Phenylobacterium sp.]MBT9470217.1 TetR/AcrR family transcriptional regulator [Phenylobacterium sp.]